MERTKQPDFYIIFLNKNILYKYYIKNDIDVVGWNL
jgi:hypothetical protein